MTKITIQAMKGNNKSSMGTTFAEYIATMPNGTPINDSYVQPENCTYTRISGNKKTYRVLFVNARENDKAVSMELYCEETKG